MSSISASFFSLLLLHLHSSDMLDGTEDEEKWESFYITDLCDAFVVFSLLTKSKFLLSGKCVSCGATLLYSVSGGNSLARFFSPPHSPDVFGMLRSPLCYSLLPQVPYWIKCQYLTGSMSTIYQLTHRKLRPRDHSKQLNSNNTGLLLTSSWGPLTILFSPSSHRHQIGEKTGFISRY